MNKLKFKLISSYLILSIIVIFSIAFLINISFKNQFKTYITNIQTLKNEKILERVKDVFLEKDYVTKDDVKEIGEEALNDGYLIRIVDQRGNTVWDAMEEDSKLCAKVLEKNAYIMKKYVPGFKGQHIDESFIIKTDTNVYGSLIITYYGPYFFDSNDIVFFTSFNNIILGTSILAVVLSIIIGIMNSNKITKNINKIVLATQNIVKGNYKNTLNNKSNIKEIDELIDAINYLILSLNNQSNLRKRLTTDVTHELRTPITVLKSHLEALKDGVWEMDTSRIDVLYNEVDRLNDLIKNIDHLNDYENSESLNITDFDLRKLVKDVLVNYEKELNNKNIEVIIEADEIHLKADKNKITQVIINLISNSIKYSDNNKNIIIKLKTNKDNVIIHFEDQGFGIAKKDLPYIFDRFYRVDESRNKKTGGMGIGLSIVKTIVESHGGTIDVKSQLNVGTTFIITIPNK